MVVMASTKSRGVTYAIARDMVQGWFFLRERRGHAEYFPLDHDKRHARFFLEEDDQRYVGVDGLVVLERLTREVLPR